ncbi:MAG TPA: hypothetical protein VNW99_07905 [Cytophagaceae bacterium]|jgi:hypothetical protein|nr:hypothetical protein [Cytophagaceae bacterium]
MGRVEYKIRMLFEIRAYRFKELVQIYSVDAKTLRKWLHAMNVKIAINGKTYMIREVEQMVDAIGFPYQIYDIDYDNSDDKCVRKEFKRPFEVKPYRPKELAALYNTCSKTFREQWLAPIKGEIGALNGGYYLIPQVAKIIEIIGLPYFIYQDEESSKEEKSEKAA